MVQYRQTAKSINSHNSEEIHCAASWWWGFSENAMVMLCIYQLWCNGKMLLLLMVACVVLYKRKNQPCEVVMPCEEGYRVSL